MTEGRKWITLDQSERGRSETGESGRDSLVDEQRNADERRLHLLKIRMLEERIAGMHATTKQRKQKTVDERERIAADAIEDIDREHNDRVFAMQEKFHSWITRFFMLGTGALLAFCGFWLVLFLLVVLIGIVAAFVGFPLP